MNLIILINIRIFGPLLRHPCWFLHFEYRISPIKIKTCITENPRILSVLKIKPHVSEYEQRIYTHASCRYVVKRTDLRSLYLKGFPIRVICFEIEKKH